MFTSTPGPRLWGLVSLSLLIGIGPSVGCSDGGGDDDASQGASPTPGGESSPTPTIGTPTPAGGTPTPVEATATPGEATATPEATSTPVEATPTPVSSPTPADADGDGFSSPEDCNDQDGAVHPGVAEVCDGVDQNCDGSIDEGVQLTFYPDVDGDGYGNGTSSTLACSLPEGYVADPGDPGLFDCNDAEAGVHPGATEVCDGIDQNCDGSIDEGVQLTFYADTDGDGYGDAASTTLACSAPGGYVADSTDCDDKASSTHPGAAEVCDGIDQNCDGSIDEGVQLTFYADSDGDGYGAAGSTTTACTAPSGYVADNTDCNDDASSIHPGAAEVCDGIDQNCDGSIDEGVKVTFYADADGDGYGDAASTVSDCTAPAGYVADASDCNDSASSIHPGAAEVCDGIDQNCDGSIDEGVQLTFYPDSDKDGYGDPAASVQACAAPTGYVADHTDCDDTQAGVNPAALEVCDGIDQNCDGSIDEGVKLTFYADVDQDGYGNANSTTQACTVPAGYVTDSTDCNDQTSSVHPGATEVCDGVDQNCDGKIDEGTTTTFYTDADGDGYGDPNKPVQACKVSAGYVTDKTDCDDANPAAYPGAKEVCESEDLNCDGVINGSLDADKDGVCDTADVCPGGNDTSDADSDGIPDACDCKEIVVGYLPGWGPLNSSSLAYTSMQANWKNYGECPLRFVSIASGFTVSTLVASGATTLEASDPSGGNLQYSSTELQAIRDFVTQGHGGLVVSYLLNWSSSNNSAIADLVGVKNSLVMNTAVGGGTTVTIQDTTHPIARDLPTTFALASYDQSQVINGSWSNALLSGASIVMKSSSNLTDVVAYQGSAWRGVWFSVYPDYVATFDGPQALYNAYYWTSGYSWLK